jgi:phosphoglucan, water dikinase
VSAYLYFIGTGLIKCAENGTHFRPNHHADLAYNIYQTLDLDYATEQNTFLIRSIKEYLPSFDDQFTVSVPLTRIRDIAHRNDIPSWLKSDIKHRLQNKLHRCADPGDLKTCQELIQKTRADQSLSHEFKREFERFYIELQEFFNVQGVEKLLEKAVNDESVNRELVQRFLTEKHRGSDEVLNQATALR